jgi:hypothetical protein
VKGLRNARIALRTALALVAALGLFAVAPAYAEQDPVKANKLFTEAREKLKDDDREGALELLDQAENYFAHPAILLLKAKTQRELGLLEAADGTLDRVEAGKLPRPLRKVHSEERAEIEKARTVMGRLIVRVTPADALVVVDKHEHRGGYDRWRPPGDTKVEVIAPGHQPTVRTATIAAAGKVELEVALAPLRGAIRVTVPGGLKGVDVLLDGKTVEIEEARRAGEVHRVETGLGKHEVVCRRGQREVGRVVEVAFGSEVHVRCDGIEPKADVARLGLGWGGVAAGAALATYGVWGIQSYFADQEKAQRDGLIVDSNKHYGGAAYLVSGLAVGLASYWLLLREPGEPEASTTAALEPGGSSDHGFAAALAPPR